MLTDTILEVGLGGQYYVRTMDDGDPTVSSLRYFILMGIKMKLKIRESSVGKR